MTASAIQKTSSKLRFKDLHEGKWFACRNSLYLVTKVQDRDGLSGDKIKQVICQLFTEKGMRGTFEVQSDWDLRDVDVKLVWAERFNIPELPIFHNPDPDLDLLEVGK